MTLLIPLGLLALLSIIALIIIYLIRPNYQQKVVSSTYIWKLSLKYRKKRIPVSKIRNILLVLCQVLILVCLAFIIARPAILLKKHTIAKEVVAIVDASASMRTETDGVTRFERAVDKAKAKVDEAFAAGGYATVIIADEEPYYLFTRNPASAMGKAELAMDELKQSDDYCTYGANDADAAITMCESIIEENPSAEIYFYTDTTYAYVPDSINVVPIKDEQEWNAAILDVRVENIDNLCAVTVDLGCYNRSMSIDLTVSITGANGEEGKAGERLFKTTVNCDGLSDESIMFVSAKSIKEGDLPPDGLYYQIADSEIFYSYGAVTASISTGDDSLSVDNSFAVYGGTKEVIKVQYTSAMINPFMSSSLLVLQNHFKDEYEINIKEVKLDNSEKPARAGFDFYIYEHFAPTDEDMPKDGVVLLMDPTSSVSSSLGLSFQGKADASGGSAPLTREKDHPLLKSIKADEIKLSKYTRLGNYSDYTVLLSCDTYPMLLIKEDFKSSTAQRIMIMPFSLHFSENLANGINLILLMKNMFDYFFPYLTNGYVFEVGDSVTLNGRGEKIQVTNGDNVSEYSNFPAKQKFLLPGTYTVSEDTYFQKHIEKHIFVKMPSSESNISGFSDGLKNPVAGDIGSENYNDMLVYLAAALIVLLFANWLLQVRNSI